MHEQRKEWEEVLDKRRHVEVCNLVKASYVIGFSVVFTKYLTTYCALQCG